MDEEQFKAWWDFPGSAVPEPLADLVAASDTDTELFWGLFYLYNHLMRQALERPMDVAGRAEAIADFFRARGGGEFEAMFLELVARAYLMASRSADAAAALERMVSEGVGDQRSEILELAHDAWIFSAREVQTLDLRPVVLASVTRVFRKLGELEPLADVFLDAATFYSQHGARKAADRALKDALDIAEETGLDELAARVHEQAAVIAFDQRDAERSIGEARQALGILARTGGEPSWRLQVNLATALMQTGAVDEASALYEAALETAENDAQRASVHTNLASCRRRKGDLQGAEAEIARARVLSVADTGPEEQIELELIAARLAAEQGDMAGLRMGLLEACRLLDGQLARVLRLHHRRGLRERFIARLEGLLAELPPTGPTQDVLAPLAVVYGGLVADWLAILDWSEAMSARPDLDGAERDDLARRITAVTELGAPFLIGFREKNDDPWQPAPLGRPWDDLAEIVERLVKAGAPAPFAPVSMTSITTLLSRRLEEGYGLVFPTFAHDPAHIWLLEAGGYRRVAVDLRAIVEWRMARRRFEADPFARQDFIARLSRFVTQDAAAFAAALDGLSPACRGLLHMQDFSDALPIMALVLAHPSLRARMASGVFEVVTTPALYARRDQPALDRPGVVALIDSSDTLRLARDEAEVAAQVLDARRFVRLEAHDRQALIKALEDCEILIVSTHGQSLARFVDPFLADLGAGQIPHSLSVETIQTNFPHLGYRLVTLNACHGGAASARNSEQTFRTHDGASYPALLLMNRKSVVAAASWTLNDTAGYLHLLLTMRGVAEGLREPLAISRASAQLRELTRAQALDLVALAPATAERTKVEEGLRLAPEIGLFSHPYASGGLGAFGLV